MARPNKAILAEHWMYSRANLRRVVEVPTASHVVMLSHLNIVTDLIQDAARAST